MSPTATTPSIDTCSSPRAPISQATPNRTARRPTTVVASQRCRTGGRACRRRRGWYEDGPIHGTPAGPRPPGRTGPRPAPGPRRRRRPGRRAGGLRSRRPRFATRKPGGGAQGACPHPARSWSAPPGAPRSPVSAAGFAVEAGTDAASSFVLDAPEPVPDGPPRWGTAAHRLVDDLAEVASQRAGQRPYVLRNLAELVVPGHTKRLRRPASSVIHPGVESDLVRWADPPRLLQTGSCRGRGRPGRHC